MPRPPEKKSNQRLGCNPNCKLYNHPKRLHIENDIRANKKYKEIIATYSKIPHTLTVDNISKHYRNHIKEQTVKKIKNLMDQGVLDVRSTIEELQDTYDQVDNLILELKNIDVSDVNILLKVTDRLTKLYKLRADLVKTNKSVIEDVKTGNAKEQLKDVAALLHGNR